MREERSIIGTKGLITLPKEWRESHNIDANEMIQISYKLGGAIVVTPINRELSSLEKACINYLEKGPSVGNLREQVGILKEIQEVFSQALESIEAGSDEA